MGFGEPQLTYPLPLQVHILTGEIIVEDDFCGVYDACKSTTELVESVLKFNDTSEFNDDLVMAPNPST